MSTAQVLTKALKLIEDKKHWIQGAYARDKEGEQCDELTKRAYSFCAIGAIRHVAGFETREAIKAQLSLKEACGDGITVFNDNHSHRSVVAAFKRAIKKAKEKKPEASK